MKQTLPLIACSFFVTAAFAQSPTLTSTINYGIGDTQITLTADTTGIEPGPAGANQTWDFSQIKQDSAQDSSFVYYVDPKTTLYAGDFKTANVAGEVPESSGVAYNFYGMSDTSVENFGYAEYDSASTSSNLLKYKNAFTQLIYPLQYEDTYSSMYNAPPTGNNAGYTIGTYIVKADAYGSMKIRNTQYDSVLRLYVINSGADSIYAPGFGSFELPDDSTNSYIYYCPGKKSPILTISYSPYPYNKRVTFNDFDHVRLTAIAPEKNDSISFGLFPNPAKETLQVSLSIKQFSEAEITITNELGQVVKSLNNIALQAGANNMTIDLQGVHSGIYFVNMVSGGQTGVQKLVID